MFRYIEVRHGTSWGYLRILCSTNNCRKPYGFYRLPFARRWVISASIPAPHETFDSKERTAKWLFTSRQWKSTFNDFHLFILRFIGNYMHRVASEAFY
jgi:hypothetical protein